MSGFAFAEDKQWPFTKSDIMSSEAFLCSPSIRKEGVEKYQLDSKMFPAPVKYDCREFITSGESFVAIVDLERQQDSPEMFWFFSMDRDGNLWASVHGFSSGELLESRYLPAKGIKSFAPFWANIPFPIVSIAQHDFEPCFAIDKIDIGVAYKGKIINSVLLDFYHGVCGS